MEGILQEPSFSTKLFLQKLKSLEVLLFADCYKTSAGGMCFCLPTRRGDFSVEFWRLEKCDHSHLSWTPVSWGDVQASLSEHSVWGGPVPNWGTILKCPLDAAVHLFRMAYERHLLSAKHRWIWELEVTSGNDEFKTCPLCSFLFLCVCKIIGPPRPNTADKNTTGGKFMFRFCFCSHLEKPFLRMARVLIKPEMWISHVCNELQSHQIPRKIAQTKSKWDGLTLLLVLLNVTLLPMIRRESFWLLPRLGVTNRP